MIIEIWFREEHFQVPNTTLQGQTNLIELWDMVFLVVGKGTNTSHGLQCRVERV